MSGLEKFYTDPSANALVSLIWVATVGGVKLYSFVFQLSFRGLPKKARCFCAYLPEVRKENQLSVALQVPFCRAPILSNWN